MSDQDIIRKAVELADGWYLDDDHGNEGAHNGLYFFPLDVEFLPDIIAAQLVRQVDSIGGEVWFRDREEVFVFKGGERARGRGADRTMNILRTVVESGVLDKLREVSDG